MRPLPWFLAERYRVLLAPAHPYHSAHGDNFGLFSVPHTRTNVWLKVLAAAGDEEHPWEHVSVSLPNRCPNWPEMTVVKELFWRDDEAVMQLHPPRSDYRNCHPYCLHLWRPLKATIPLPPGDMVGPKDPPPEKPPEA